jgi:hypothetical protein
MSAAPNVYEEIEGLYRIIPLLPLRQTPGVRFDEVPIGLVPKIDAIDRVIHNGGATSPGPIKDVKRPWYMHPWQDDNLIVLHGKRHVDVYTRKHGQMESFTVTPEQVLKNDEITYDGAAMLVWPSGVFHRIRSDETIGSASLNLAVHKPGFDIRTNFNIYDLNTKTGEFTIIREGHLDQPQD